MDDRTTTTNFNRTEPADRPGTKSDSKSATALKRRRRVGYVVLLLLVAAAGWWLFVQRPAPAPSRQNAINAPVPVGAMVATMGDIDITLNALGTVTSLATVTLKSQISGQLMRVNYMEGQLVKQGDLLVEIDSRPYELALAQAQGALERDQALLQTAELDLKRYQDLAKTNAIPRQQLDTQASVVLQSRGNVVSDQAMIDTQKLNIAYCHIIAPVSGRVGLRLVDPGNYVTPQDATGLVVLTQVEPITVIFPVAEDNLPQIAKRMKEGAKLPVTAFDRSGSTMLSAGELKSLDSQIDTTTGTLKMRAEFANQDGALFPNQFVNVQVLVDVLRNTTIVSTSAVQRGAPGTFVYAVNANNTVEVRPVTLGPSNGDRVAVTNGLSPGDRVVVDGADKLRNGARIVIRGGEQTPAAGQPPGALPARPPGRTGPGAIGTPPTPGATPTPGANPRQRSP
jgi:membrane fusion protein, multidrug efflux system